MTVSGALRPCTSVDGSANRRASVSGRRFSTVEASPRHPIPTTSKTSARNTCPSTRTSPRMPLPSTSSARTAPNGAVSQRLRLRPRRTQTHVLCLPCAATRAPDSPTPVPAVDVLLHCGVHLRRAAYHLHDQTHWRLPRRADEPPWTRELRAGEGDEYGACRRLFVGPKARDEEGLAIEYGGRAERGAEGEGNGVGEARAHSGIFATRALRKGKEIVPHWEWCIAWHHRIAQLTNILRALGTDAECACAGMSTTAAAASSSTPVAPSISLQIPLAKEERSLSGSEMGHDDGTEAEHRREDGERASRDGAGGLVFVSLRMLQPLPARSVGAWEGEDVPYTRASSSFALLLSTLLSTSGLHQYFSTLHASFASTSAPICKPKSIACPGVQPPSPRCRSTNPSELGSLIGAACGTPARRHGCGEPTPPERCHAATQRKLRTYAAQWREVSALERTPPPDGHTDIRPTSSARGAPAAPHFANTMLLSLFPSPLLLWHTPSVWPPTLCTPPPGSEWGANGRAAIGLTLALHSTVDIGFVAGEGTTGAQHRLLLQINFDYGSGLRVARLTPPTRKAQCPCDAMANAMAGVEATSIKRHEPTPTGFAGSDMSDTERWRRRAGKGCGQIALSPASIRDATKSKDRKEAGAGKRHERVPKYWCCQSPLVRSATRASGLMRIAHRQRSRAVWRTWQPGAPTPEVGSGTNVGLAEGPAAAGGASARGTASVISTSRAVAGTTSFSLSLPCAFFSGCSVRAPSPVPSACHAPAPARIPLPSRVRVSATPAIFDDRWLYWRSCGRQRWLARKGLRRWSRTWSRATAAAWQWGTIPRRAAWTREQEPPAGFFQHRRAPSEDAWVYPTLPQPTPTHLPNQTPGSAAHDARRAPPPPRPATVARRGISRIWSSRVARSAHSGNAHNGGRMTRMRTAHAPARRTYGRHPDPEPVLATTRKCSSRAPPAGIPLPHARRIPIFLYTRAQRASGARQGVRAQQ
ncbi:hypothetical protein B0H19DRAFT_1334160 [Mycena capillaripes]|nr:hypothetical protein B0H19DRAFT_1334160 [Mycena capillaripes]